MEGPPVTYTTLAPLMHVTPDHADAHGSFEELPKSIHPLFVFQPEPAVALYNATSACFSAAESCAVPQVRAGAAAMSPETARKHPSATTAAVPLAEA